jgi:hypothetical protein
VAPALDPRELGALDPAGEPFGRVAEARNVVVAADHERRRADFCCAVAQVSRGQRLAPESVTLARRARESRAHVADSRWVLGQKACGKPHLQQILDERNDAMPARGHGALGPHGTHLLGIARRRVDQHETVDHVVGGEVLGDEAAERDSGDVRARDFVLDEHACELIREVLDPIALVRHGCRAVAGQIVAQQRELARQRQREVPEAVIDAETMQEHERRPGAGAVQGDGSRIERGHGEPLDG